MSDAISSSRRVAEANALVAGVLDDPAATAALPSLERIADAHVRSACCSRGRAKRRPASCSRSRGGWCARAAGPAGGARARPGGARAAGASWGR